MATRPLLYDTAAAAAHLRGSHKAMRRLIDRLGPITLRRLRSFPTHEQLALSLTSLPVAGAMALYGEKIVRHELVIDAARFEDRVEEIFPTAEVILAGFRIRTGAEIVCPPALRPAVVLLIAMLASKGRSVLRSTYVIHRGYEDLAERLNELGANIETFRDI